MGKKLEDGDDLSRWGIVEDTQLDAHEKNITLIFPYYENPNMLKKQLETINSYPEWIRAHLEISICDDMSTEFPLEDQLPYTLPKVRQFNAWRVLEKRKWGWPICRNICANYANSEWLLMTDIDHIVPEDTMRLLITHKHNPLRGYKLTRQLVDGTPYSIHANTYFMTKRFMQQIGYYTEDFLGLYGTDGMFKDKVKKNSGGDIYILKAPVTLYGRDDIADASTTQFARKSDENNVELNRIRAEIKANPDHIPKFLSLPYERII